MAESNVDRIRELEDGVRHAERWLEEARIDRDQARELVKRMEEQVKDASAVIESWKEAFQMQLTDDGQWCWAERIYEEYDALVDKHNELVKDWISSSLTTI
jgi:phage shock protein A